MDNNSKTAEICRQMNEVRCNLGDEVEEIVGSARQLADWRYYLRKYPWLCLAGAAALGYFVVPKRIEIISPSADALEELSRRNQLVVKSKPEAKPKNSLAAAALAFAANALIRAGIAYVGQNAGKLLGDTAAEGAEDAQPYR